MLHPAGPAARTIADLWWMLLAAGLVIFVGVMGLLIAAVLRHADGAVEKTVVQNTMFSRIWFWGFGLAFPLITLSALTVYGLVLGERLLPRSTSDVVTVRAEARQWAWTFGYADLGKRLTDGVLHIPAGRPVDVEITSTDVIHSFWVPQLAGKLDAIPGHINVLRLEATSPGTYAGQSAEFSGSGYREHVFWVRAHDAVSWAAFLKDSPP